MWAHLFSGKPRQKKAARNGDGSNAYDWNLRTSVPLSGSKFTKSRTGFSISCEEIKVKKKQEMSNKVSNFSDLIQRVASSCLLNPLPRGPESVAGDEISDINRIENEDTEEEEEEESNNDEEEEISSEEEEENEEDIGVWIAKKGNDKKEKDRTSGSHAQRMMEFEALMGEIFDAVSALKRSYVGLQEAHCPWDPEKMSAADMAVLGELSRLARLRERYKRMCRGGRLGFAPLREAVAPYEAAVEELKRELKNKEAEVENLKEKLKSVSVSGKKGKSQSRRKVSCIQGHVAAAPVPELFEATMAQVKEASKAFTALLLSLMRAARWDIAAAVRSIECATAAAAAEFAINETRASVIGPRHAKYALESYVCRKIFYGFDHETFYIDGSLSSLIHPEQFRRDCFSQFRDMKAMDPTELLGILPTCHFGKFCSKKYLSIVHPKMEESLFGNLEQHHLVLAGNHPRSQFYGEFLRLAKAVWLLHLLAFALDPSPCLFLATRGAEFHPDYMESVVARGSGGRLPVGQVVGIPVSPGFKLGNGSVIKARVYLVSKT